MLSPGSSLRRHDGNESGVENGQVNARSQGGSSACKYHTRLASEFEPEVFSRALLKIPIKNYTGVKFFIPWMLLGTSKNSNLYRSQITTVLIRRKIA